MNDSCSMYYQVRIGARNKTDFNFVAAVFCNIRRSKISCSRRSNSRSGSSRSCIAVKIAKMP